MMGGPRSASRWGLLLRMEEEDFDGGVVVVGGGAAEVMGWVSPGSSCAGGGPVYGGLSNSPPNSMSWLLISCNMSEEGIKTQSLLLTRRKILLNKYPDKYPIQQTQNNLSVNKAEIDLLHFNLYS